MPSPSLGFASLAAFQTLARARARTAEGYARTGLFDSRKRGISFVLPSDFSFDNSHAEVHKLASAFRDIM